MQVYKLKYTDKETAIADLIAKGVIDENGEYINGTQAVVEIGVIILNDATYDEEGNVITEPIYAEGYHYDVMSENEIDFEIADITNLVNNPKHQFAGYEK